MNVHGWVFSEVFEGQLDPQFIVEVKAPNPAQLRAALYFDEADAIKSPQQKDAEWCELNRETGGAAQSIRRTKLIDLTLAQIIQGTQHSYNAYRNSSGWLPGGQTYFEYPVKSAHLISGKARYVVSRDRQHVYLTATHYYGFTVRKRNKQVLNRSPFYELIP